MIRAAAWALLAPFVLSSCVTIQFIRSQTGDPLSTLDTQTLEPGASFTTCLETLGAPDLVRPTEFGNIIVAYAWSDAFEWGFEISYSPARFASLQLDFESVAIDATGVVLRFDADLRLASIDHGKIRELLPSAQGSTTMSRINRAPR